MLSILICAGSWRGTGGIHHWRCDNLCSDGLPTGPGAVSGSLCLSLGPAVHCETPPPTQDVTRGVHRLLAGSPRPSPCPLWVASATPPPSLSAGGTASQGTLAMGGTSVVVTTAGCAPGVDWVGPGMLLNPRRARDGPPWGVTGPQCQQCPGRARRQPLHR